MGFGEKRNLLLANENTVSTIELYTAPKNKYKNAVFLFMELATPPPPLLLTYTYSHSHYLPCTIK